MQSDPAAASTSLEGIYCIRSCNNFCLIIVVLENDLSGQTYLYRIIYRHSQILANTPNIMGTLRSAECPRNIERITSSKTFSLGMVYSKPLGGKSRIVKLVREMKKKMVLLPEPYCILAAGKGRGGMFLFLFLHCFSFSLLPSFSFISSLLFSLSLGDDTK